MSNRRLTIGVLALQGAFAKHIEMFDLLDGVNAVEVRSGDQLDACDGLVIPGGESTVISQLLTSSSLLEPVTKWCSEDKPVWGTCAGMIILASGLANKVDADEKVIQLAALDITVERNGYGRQIDSFETDLDVVGQARSFKAMFIRAPKVTEVGSEVEVLAEHETSPVLLQQRNVLASSFHPELSDSSAIHKLFIANCF